MKKSLIFALAAGAFLASCSSDDDVNVGNVVDDGSKVAIKLGFATGDITTRAGVGTVGDIASGTNQWSQQLVNVLMFDENFAYAKENSTDATNLFDASTGKMVTPDGYGQGLAEDMGGLVKYYPLAGKYSFFGFFNGGINTNGSAISAVDFNADGDAVVGDLLIDGSQDVMVAKAPKIPTWAVDGAISGQDGWDATAYGEGAAQAYSAFAARRGVQPVLSFNHLLTRFNFKVLALDGLTKQNVAVSEIKVFSPYSGTIKLAWKADQEIDAVKDNLITWAQEAADLPKDRTTVATAVAATPASGANGLTLMQRPTEGTQNETLVPLRPVYSENAVGETGVDAAEADDYTQIGEGLLVAPGMGFETADNKAGKYMMQIKTKEKRKSETGKVYVAEANNARAYYWSHHVDAVAGTDEVPAVPAIDENHYIWVVDLDGDEDYDDDAIAIASAADNNFNATTAGTASATGYKFGVIDDQNDAFYQADAAFHQFLVDANATLQDVYTYKTVTYVATIKSPEAEFAFKAGSTYNVLIQLAGSTEIKVYTKLVAWVAGTDITVNPNDEAFEAVAPAAALTASDLAASPAALTMNAATGGNTVTDNTTVGVTSSGSGAYTFVYKDDQNADETGITAAVTAGGKLSVTIDDTVAAGAYTITINQAADATYDAGSVTVALTVQ